MGKDSLTTYLRDHLAGSAAAIEILEALRDAHAAQALGPFAAEMVAEVRRDRTTLEDLVQRKGNGSSVLEDATPWLNAKLGQFTLGRELPADHGTLLGALEALEVVALGILIKQALWDALKALAVADRLDGLDLAALTERARAQRGEIEQGRPEAARKAPE